MINKKLLSLDPLWASGKTIKCYYITKRYWFKVILCCDRVMPSTIALLSTSADSSTGVVYHGDPFIYS